LKGGRKAGRKEEGTEGRKKERKERNEFVLPVALLVKAATEMGVEKLTAMVPNPVSCPPPNGLLRSTLEVQTAGR
jgi:hypothetical protein